MVGITIEELHKAFPSGKGTKQVLDGITLTISEGEVVAIRGDNGCGKTTLLNIIAGIDAPSSGSVRFNGLNGEHLRVGFAPQDYTSSLLPWFNVLENVAIPLRLRGSPPNERRKKARMLLDMLGFRDLPSNAYPHQISGGQKQKVAVARSLIQEPQLLLLDEPFANLDAHTRRDLERALENVHEERHPTIIYVSHELDRCIALADRVVIMHGNPAKVARDFRIPLPRPRSGNVVVSVEYTRIRLEILTEEEKLYVGNL